MRTEFLIDADGMLWPDAGSLGLSQHQRLVSEHGFIRVHQQVSSIAVSLNADIVSDVAIGKLLFALLEVRPSRVELSWFDTGWHTKAFVQTRGLAEKLAELTAPSSQTYRAAARDLARLPTDNPFANIFAAWRAHAGKVDAAFYLDLFPDVLRERFFVLDLAANRSQLTFDCVGFGFPLLSNDWAANCAGAPFEHQADYAYACAVARAYRQVGRQSEPLWEYVQAAIDVPLRGHCPVRYQRLILPILGENDTMKLLGTTFLDPSIKISSEA